MAKKKKEQTPEEKLKSLYELQLIDSEIDQIEILKGELPMEVKDLEDNIEGIKTRISKLEGNISQAEKEIAAQQRRKKEAEALIDKYVEQEKNIKNNREYEALQKEKEVQELEVKLSKKHQERLEKSIEKTQEALSVVQEQLETNQKMLDEKKKELEVITSKNQKKEKALRKESEKARKKIEDRLLKAYDKIRNAYRNGLAVVTVQRDSCGGCFNKVPPQTQLEIGLRKKIIACEHCGRVLVDDNILETTETATAKAEK